MNWERVQLADLFQVKHGYAFKSAFFEESGPYALLTPGNFNETGGFRDRGDKQPYYVGDVPEGYVLCQDDLIVAMTEQEHGLLGSSAWIPASDRYLHNQRLGRIVELDDMRIDKRFLYYLFNTREVRGQIAGSASGTKVRHTSPERIGRTVVNLPSLDVQRQIAGTLTGYDDLIENNRRRIGLLEKSARLLYEEWFVHFKFPGREHNRILNGVPEGWQIQRLDAVAKINRATLPGSFDGQIEYVDIASVLPGQITGTTEYNFREAPSRARRTVEHGDVIWSCVRPNRRSHAVIWKPKENLTVSTGFAVISPVSVPSTYIYFATTTDAFVGYLNNQARGVAYPAVLVGDFERATILLPSSSLLVAFDTFAEPIFSKIQNLRQQNQKLRAARDLLLPRLMDGTITV